MKNYRLTPARRPRPGPFSLFLLGSILAAFVPALGSPESKPKKDRAVIVQAFADRQAAVPGDTLNLAIQMKIDEGWHVYWRSPGGDTGMATRIEWKMPGGFLAGRTQFPVPEPKYDKTLEETSYILAGSPVFVTPVKVPDTAKPGEEITLTAQVSWLMCKKECIPGQAEVAFKLPVVAKGTKANPANEKLFEKARGAFPLPIGKAEHVKFSGGIQPDKLKPGDRATAVLTVDIEAKHHMQSHKPNSAAADLRQEELIPAYVFVEPTPGFEISDVEYPKAHERNDKLLGKLSEYSGKVEFQIPITVENDADKTGRWIRGVFQYQICTDAGTCYPPQHVEFAIPVQMAGGGPPKSADEWTSASLSGSPEKPPPISQGHPPDSAAQSTPTASINVLTRIQDRLLRYGYAGAIAVAFIGGFILNLMPCVLPVISLKMLSFVKQSHEERGRIFRLGLTYAFGIMVFFGLIAFLFWQTNKQFGWGQLFQRPQIVLVLAAIVTAFALSLFGVFAVFTPKVINRLDEKVEGEGYLSAFATGLLATFLGTACTAPFLSAAIGAASRFSTTQGAWIFVAVGVGMAFPFVVLAAHPAWLRLVPRPGPWMGTFECGMGFLLLGTVIWLLNPLRGQLGDFGLLLSLIFLLAVAIAVWIKGKIEFGAPVAKKAKLYTLALIILIVGWLLPFRFLSSIKRLIEDQMQRQELLADGQLYRQGGGKPGDLSANSIHWPAEGIPWQRYKRDRALAYVKAGYTVFIDYTADWCVNCKVMLKAAIEQPSVIQTMKELNVIPYTADYTLPVPEIKDDLARFKRGGVPVFVVYKPGDIEHPEILPEIIRSSDLVEALKRAGPSKVQLAQKP